MTSPSPHEPDPTEDPRHEPARGERIQALLMLLPAAMLAWPGPGSYLVDDWAPAATGSAVLLLATTPALFVLLLRRHATAARGWFLLLPMLAAGLLAFGAENGTLGFVDVFERARATFLVLAGTALLVSGASLGAAGRSVFARGLALLSIAVTLVAHFDTANAHAGALGNTGSISQAALAGAVVSAALLFESFGPWSLVHGAALVLQLTYVGRVPVIAGTLAAAVGFAALALFRAQRAPRIGAAALAVVALFIAFGPRLAGDASGPESTSAGVRAHTPAPARAGDTGGIAVRTSVWWSTLVLAADHPFLGAGLGQFAARFPEFRDPEEIELSSHQRRIAQETEVEHGHCDYLTVLAEGGLVFASGVFVLFGLVAAAAVRALKRRALADAALGAAALALLANGCVHGVLLHDPVSASLAFGVFGAVLGPVRSEQPSRVRRFVPLFLLLASAFAATSALAVVRHARALLPIERGTELTSEDVGRTIEAALAEVPHSPLALALHARWLERFENEPARARAAWSAVLERRPMRVEALVQSGLAAIRAKDEDGAMRAWTAARAVDPRHPGVLWNLMTLAYDQDRTRDAGAISDELALANRLDHDRLLSLATRLELEGRESSAQALWTRIAPEIASAGSDKNFQLARDSRAAGDEHLARALELRAQRGYAREHALHEAWNDALRSYRQVFRVAGVDPAPRRLRVEYLAALARSGNEDDARAELERLEGWENELPHLPGWVVKTLVGEAWTPR